MLDQWVNQAAGLSGLARPSWPRLIAVASHGQQEGELPLLWSLCTAWVGMCQPVLVLDGHSRESDANPGLLQLLTAPEHEIRGDLDPPPWTVLPAALGFNWLENSGFNSHTVGGLFQHRGLVVVYADAPRVASLFKGSGLSPLLVLPPLKSASVTAYQALKQLLLDAGLEPTVAHIKLPAARFQSQTKASQTLQNCAQSFLGLTLHPVSLSAMASSNQSVEEINRLALQLLENAVMLEAHPADRTH